LGVEADHTARPIWSRREVSATSAATCRIRSASAREVPPNFITFIGLILSGSVSSSDCFSPGRFGDAEQQGDSSVAGCAGEFLGLPVAAAASIAGNSGGGEVFSGRRVVERGSGPAPEPPGRPKELAAECVSRRYNLRGRERD
jgi:hypothetical protein